MNKTIFSLNDVHFSYLGKYPALCGVTIDIKQGEKIGIIGANGSGKSTLLQMLDGLIFPDRGSVHAFGSELRENAFYDEGFSSRFRKRVGLVFQNPDVQLFCPTVKEDIMFGPLQLGVAVPLIKKRFEEFVDVFKIGGLLDRAPHQLSIGEKRKVAIASTLMVDPEVLLLDEPTAGLDPLTTRHIIDLLIHANMAGKTIITSTHDLHIVEEIADIVYVFNHEKKIIRGAPADEVLKDLPLLEANNLLHIHRHRHQGTVHVHPHQHVDQHHH
jgi:cobalt/nickel transport system ATP-binding protein